MEDIVDSEAPAADAEPPAPAWQVNDVVLGTGAALAARVASFIAWGVAVVIIGPRLRAPEGTGGYLGWVATQVELGETPNAPGISLSVLLLLQIPLWLGLLGVPLLLIWRRKQKPAEALALSYKHSDLPLGLLIGVASQVIMVPLIYLALSPLINSDDLSAPARQLSDKANDPLSIVLLILIVLVGAPIIEEIFFRGMIFGALRTRYSNYTAIAVSAAFFGLFHFQWLQLPALVAFGIVAAVCYGLTRRLSLAIWAHVGFNAVTVANLLWFS